MSHGPESAFTKWLKKYRYINIALIYLGTALVVIHFAEAVVHGLHMPDITFSLIVVLALAGLPVVLLIAWAMGHKKLETSEDVTIAKPVKRNWVKIITASVLSVLLFATSIFAYNKFFYHSKFTGKEKSIAVLPFTNMSSDKENEYFSDGMTEEITTQLSKIAELKVINPNSTKLFKDSKKTLKEIAEELEVASLCKGSVRKEGNNIRITAQLIDATTQEQIWADYWDREFKEVFKLQSEVAQTIAYQLNAELTKGEKKKIESKPTNNPEAYNYYLQASYLGGKFFETYKEEYFSNSKAMYEKAISADPNYALAYAGLADLYNSYTAYGNKDSSFFVLQNQNIEKAWSIDSTLDIVNLTRGYVFQAESKFEEAYKYFRRAVEIAPNNSNNLFGLSQMLSILGLIEESKILIEKSIQLDPLSSPGFTSHGSIERIQFNLDYAIKDFQTALKLEPDMPYALISLTQVYCMKNRFEEARNFLRKYEKLNHKIEGFYPLMGYIFAKLGDKKKALELSQSWEIYLVLGMKEECLTALLKSNSDENEPLNSNNYIYLKNYSQHKDFDIIRSDPRFIELMEKKRTQYEENKKKFSIADLIN